MTPDEARIKARYPSRRPVDLLVGGVAGAALLGAIILVTLQGLEQSNPPVVGDVHSFTVESPNEVRAEIIVQRRDPATPAVCTLTAQAESFEIVGEATLDVPPGTEKLTRVPVSVKTIREATSIVIDGCRVA
ncbi:MAG: DUF4307 domain-containing protein [Tessaracoccus sp.]|uniref:DUF4307 domain-containing protein n=1 Tax=Tessaracoccus sp. TaxID=1971211 RepID=UPI001EBD0875|nr:DUF4307 domain-containing protein [Tessaracoccus sp.]MBK7819691.1 DUF4307 domain-containing protein [Tessaracoccus sp.]